MKLSLDAHLPGNVFIILFHMFSVIPTFVAFTVL
jgi:hypothetical protein